MISKTALHAIRAVVALAELPEGDFCGAGAIAKQVGAPQNYLGKLLQTLAQSGILHSQRGLGGGFQLARDPAQITLYDVAEPIDHVSRWTGCFLGRPQCSASNPCAMHFRWAKVRDVYLDMLINTTIAEVIRHGGVEMVSAASPSAD
ncbi:MAG: Rrf2 family transcriptional regulator [Candidatus Hydrogenedentes bacterium]|nr:Rrf2 family transcriptional regulator [Candidatus Hydrogenedentota bacterium]